MNPCITCGRQIRFRSMRVSFNRKQGVAHWLHPEGDTGCPCLSDFAWTKWRADKQCPTITEQKIAEWNNLNPLARRQEDTK